MSAPENPSSAPWTYRMEVSPTGQGPTSAVPPPSGDPTTLLRHMVHLQHQTLEILRQNTEINRQQLELTREIVQVNREQRARQAADIERWRAGHAGVLETSRETLEKLEQVHAALMSDMAHYVDDNHENLLDGGFSLSDFVDRFGPRLAHLNTMLAVLRPLAATNPKADG